MKPRYRDSISILKERQFLTDGGLETTLVFRRGMELPHFAAFDLIRTEAGRAALENYYAPYLEAALLLGTGFVLESATWRASRDWGARLGYDAEALAIANRACVAMLHDLRAEYEVPGQPIIVAGNLGPRGDGYRPEERMTAEEARDYHRAQVMTLAEAGADMICAVTMTSPEEATGIVRAAQDADMPVAISFTTETDGRLPTGETLAEAIAAVDAATGGANGGGPLHYMVNCAHPTHFEHALAAGGDWVARIGGIRANASKLSHAELDESTTLDDGDPLEFGADYRRLRALLPGLRIIGGCCGTDHRHVIAAHGACRKAASGERLAYELSA